MNCARFFQFSGRKSYSPFGIPGRFGAAESLTNGNERKFIPFPVIITAEFIRSEIHGSTLNASIGAIQCNGTLFDLFS